MEITINKELKIATVRPAQGGAVSSDQLSNMVEELQAHLGSSYLVTKDVFKVTESNTDPLSTIDTLPDKERAQIKKGLAEIDLTKW